MMSGEEKKVLKHQLNSIQGQITSIDKMIAGDRNAEDIYIQFKAVEGIVDKALFGILDDLFRKNFAKAIVKGIEACPGDCKDCDRLEILNNKRANKNSCKKSNCSNLQIKSRWHYLHRRLYY